MIVKARVLRQPTLHFVVLVNLVERRLRQLTQGRVGRGTFRGVRELIEAIVAMWKLTTSKRKVCSGKRCLTKSSRKSAAPEPLSIKPQSAETLH